MNMFLDYDDACLKKYIQLFQKKNFHSIINFKAWKILYYCEQLL